MCVLAIVFPTRVNREAAQGVHTRVSCAGPDAQASLAWQTWGQWAKSFVAWIRSWASSNGSAGRNGLACICSCFRSSKMAFAFCSLADSAVEFASKRSSRDFACRQARCCV